MSDHLFCKSCTKKILPDEKHFEVISNERTNHFCFTCYTDDTIWKMLDDKELMDALQLIKDKGYPIKKLRFILRHTFDIDL
jgi:hypothetical protein